MLLLYKYSYSYLQAGKKKIKKREERRAGISVFKKISSCEGVFSFLEGLFLSGISDSIFIKSFFTQPRPVAFWSNFKKSSHRHPPSGAYIVYTSILFLFHRVARGGMRTERTPETRPGGILEGTCGWIELLTQPDLSRTVSIWSSWSKKRGRRTTSGAASRNPRRDIPSSPW